MIPDQVTRRVDSPEARSLARSVRSSFILLALFYTNLLEFYPPRMEGDTLVFPIYLPEDFRAPFADPLTATGPAILEIFDNPEKYAGKSLPVPQFGANEGLVREILGMVEFAVEYGYFRKDRDLLWSRQVDPDALTWEQFLRTTGWAGEKQSFAA